MVKFIILLIVLIPALFFIYKRAVGAWAKADLEEKSDVVDKEKCCEEQTKEESLNGDKDNGAVTQEEDLND